MRLPFRRTQKPVAPRVYEPGADSPYVPREGVWMEPVQFGVSPVRCPICGQDASPYNVHRQIGKTVDTWLSCEPCGAKLVAQLRRERESA